MPQKAGKQKTLDLSLSDDDDDDDELMLKPSALSQASQPSPSSRVAPSQAPTSASSTESERARRELEKEKAHERMVKKAKLDGMAFAKHLGVNDPSKLFFHKTGKGKFSPCVQCPVEQSNGLVKLKKDGDKCIMYLGRAHASAGQFAGVSASSLVPYYGSSGDDADKTQWNRSLVENYLKTIKSQKCYQGKPGEHLVEDYVLQFTLEKALEAQQQQSQQQNERKEAPGAQQKGSESEGEEEGESAETFQAPEASQTTKAEPATTTASQNKVSKNNNRALAERLITGKKMKLRAGDYIKYVIPCSKFETAFATVAKVDPRGQYFKLHLSDSRNLSNDDHIALCSRKLHGKLVPVPGVDPNNVPFTTVSNFQLQTSHDQSVEIVHHAASVQAAYRQAQAKMADAHQKAFDEVFVKGKQQNNDDVSNVHSTTTDSKPVATSETANPEAKAKENEPASVNDNSTSSSSSPSSVRADKNAVLTPNASSTKFPKGHLLSPEWEHKLKHFLEGVRDKRKHRRHNKEEVDIQEEAILAALDVRSRLKGICQGQGETKYDEVLDQVQNEWDVPVSRLEDFLKGNEKNLINLSNLKGLAVKWRVWLGSQPSSTAADEPPETVAVTVSGKKRRASAECR